MYTATRSTTASKAYSKKFDTLEAAKAWVFRYIGNMNFNGAEIDGETGNAWLRLGYCREDERREEYYRQTGSHLPFDAFFVHETTRTKATDPDKASIMTHRWLRYRSREDTRPWHEDSPRYVVWNPSRSLTLTVCDTLEEARRLKAELDGEAD